VGPWHSGDLPGEAVKIFCAGFRWSAPAFQALRSRNPLQRWDFQQLFR